MAMIGVGICVRDGQGRVLLGRRARSDPGEWSMPGGKVDQASESFEDAASRELREETGIEIAATQLRVVGFILDYPNVTTRLTGVVTAPVGRYIPRLTEPHSFSMWEYFSQSALPQPLFEATAQALELLREGPRWRGGRHGYLVGELYVPEVCGEVPCG